MADEIEITIISRIKRPDGRIDLTFTRSDTGEQTCIIGAPAHLESTEDILGYLGAYAAINAAAQITDAVHPTEVK